jgi:hypothetical protein
MRHLIVVASISALAVSAASCGSSREGANSSSDLLSAASITGPSPSGMTEARGGNGGGKGGGGGSTGGGGTTPTGGGTFGEPFPVLVVDRSGPGVVNYRDTISFVVITAAAQPNVIVHCNQGTTQVFVMQVGFFDAYPWPKEFYLGSGDWHDGPAECTATMYTTDGRSTTTLAKRSFHVDGIPVP